MDGALLREACCTKLMYFEGKLRGGGCFGLERTPLMDLLQSIAQCLQPRDGFKNSSYLLAW